MDSIMKPFIFVYHMVSKVLSIPSKFIKNSTDELQENLENSKLEKLRQESVVEEMPDLDQNFSGIGEQFHREVKPLTSYKYYMYDFNKKKVIGFFDAESESDVRGFLTAQGYEVLKVEKRKWWDVEIGGNGKLKAGSLAFSLTQLSTYIKAGIPLVDAVRILSKQASKKREKRVYERLVYDLLKGENLSVAMEKQESKFPRLLINMVKTAEMTGDLPSVLDDMADYYTSMDQTRRQMISAMTYPAVVFFLAICVLVFMLLYLVPQFVKMFESQNATLPGITLFIMGASDFLKANYLGILFVLVLLGFLLHYLYQNVSSFREKVQIAAMHLPVFGKIIIYNEIANFTKTFASLLNHGVFITDSMEVLGKITNNEVYKRIIRKTINNLGKGETISKAFEGEWAFPIVAYEMLVTGEKTGQLGLMMEKVADHFQNLHKNLVNQLKSLLEPIMIVSLAAIVGVILLSIVIPMFDIYGKIN